MKRFYTFFVLIFAVVLLTYGTSEVSEGQVCKVGDVINPGERCQDPGTGRWFKVFDDEEITGIAFNPLSGGIIHTDLDTYSEFIDESNYFEVSKRVDGSWEIKSVTRLKPLPTKIIDPGSPPIYWAAVGSGRIQRATLNGSNVENLISGSDFTPYRIALDTVAGKIFFAGWDIRWADLNGKNIGILVPSSGGSIGPFALDAARGRIYWSDAFGGIKRTAYVIVGDTIKNIVPEVRSVRGIALDVAGGKIYWTEDPLEQQPRCD